MAKKQPNPQFDYGFQPPSQLQQVQSAIGKGQTAAMEVSQVATDTIKQCVAAGAKTTADIAACVTAKLVGVKDAAQQRVDQLSMAAEAALGGSLAKAGEALSSLTGSAKPGTVPTVGGMQLPPPVGLGPVQLPPALLPLAGQPGAGVGQLPPWQGPAPGQPAPPAGGGIIQPGGGGILPFPIGQQPPPGAVPPFTMPAGDGGQPLPPGGGLLPQVPGIPPPIPPPGVTPGPPGLQPPPAAQPVGPGVMTVPEYPGMLPGQVVPPAGNSLPVPVVQPAVQPGPEPGIPQAPGLPAIPPPAQQPAPVAVARGMLKQAKSLLTTIIQTTPQGGSVNVSDLPLPAIVDSLDTADHTLASMAAMAGAGASPQAGQAAPEAPTVNVNVTSGTYDQWFDIARGKLRGDEQRIVQFFGQEFRPLYQAGTRQDAIVALSDLIGFGDIDATIDEYTPNGPAD